MPGLFTPRKIGSFTLSHRLLQGSASTAHKMQSSGWDSTAVYGGLLWPTLDAGGLLIAEATAVSDTAPGAPHIPGIYTDEQVEAWKRVVDAVHSEGGIFFSQLWHAGRASHEAYQPGGAAPISSTSKPLSEIWKVPGRPSQEFSRQPRPLGTSEIPQVVEDFRQAAVNAIRAGFDGVEILGAHGYLIDQFLKDTINDREDDYGGTIENRCRFLMEVVRAVAEAIGIDRVALRISPIFDYLDAVDSDPNRLGLEVIKRLNKLQEDLGSKLAYLHVTEPRLMASEAGKVAGEEEAGLVQDLRKVYDGTFMCGGGFTRETGVEAIRNGDADLISYGRHFISNPDLVNRYKIDAPLNPYNRETFYTHDPVVGYTNYPFLDNKEGSPFGFSTRTGTEFLIA